MSSNALIDWEQLDMIADGFTPDFVEIYQEYLAEIPLLLKELEQRISTNDPVSTARMAHQIKGSSANFGFIGVSHPIAKMESEAKAGSLASALGWLAEAQNGFDGAMAEVKAKRGF
jgi:HPt (histidine-containing phosphotransfer) domain-containing protein